MPALRSAPHRLAKQRHQGLPSVKSNGNAEPLSAFFSSVLYEPRAFAREHQCPPPVSGITAALNRFGSRVRRHCSAMLFPELPPFPRIRSAVIGMIFARGLARSKRDQDFHLLTAKQFHRTAMRTAEHAYMAYVKTVFQGDRLLYSIRFSHVIDPKGEVTTAKVTVSFPHVPVSIILGSSTVGFHRGFHLCRATFRTHRVG